MRIPRKLVGLLAGALALAVPAAAQAATKVVDMGVPGPSQKAFQQSGADVNDFFPHGATVHVGDSIKFVPVGFHTVDLVPKGGLPLALFSPAGKVSGENDAAGNPFWFNGQDKLGFTPALLTQNFGKKLSYGGSKRVNSGLPLANKPKPLTVKFKKAGSFTYYCDIHPGMKGRVTVKGKKA